MNAPASSPAAGRPVATASPGAPAAGAAPAPPPTRRPLSALALVLAALLAPAARAQDLSGAIDAEAFQPAPGPLDGFVVQRSTPQPHLSWSVRAFFDYAHAPLVAGRDGVVEERIVAHRLNAHLLGSVGFLDILEVGLGLPFVLVQTGATSLALDDLSVAAVGDLRLDLKAAWPARFGDVLGLALGATARFGTGDAAAFASGGTAGFDPRLILDVQTDWFGLALDLGYRVRQNAAIAGLPVEDELTYALGVVVPLADLAGWDVGALDVAGEVWGATPAADLFGEVERSPLEASAGVRWRFPCGWIASAGAGAGLTRGYTAPTARVFLEVGYTAPPPPPGPPDADGDGIADDDDRCPMEEEDEDDFADDDGCPDPDNDDDGIPDRDDDCPAEPETVNGTDDDDGCPDFARRGDAEIAILRPILFRTNSDEILPESDAVLADVAAILQAHPELRIRVEGHTDDRGTARHNLELSRQRAAAVVRRLVERHGIPADRLSSEGFGESLPIAPNSTPEGRAKNRRVVFNILR